MKKRALAICAVAAIFAFAEAAFAEENVKIASTLSELEENLSYYIDHSDEACTLVLEGDFSPQDVQPRHIELLHEFMGWNRRNKIEGAIEYIYFDGMHSPDAFSKIRERIEGAKDKFVCVDIGHSNYMRLDFDGERYPLPDNCFAGHENLYWVCASSFLREKVPHNFCANCPNLQFVFMWEYGKAARTAFSGSNKNLLIFGRDENQKTLDEFFGEARLFDPWDYRSLDSEHFVPENQAAREKRWRNDDGEFDDYGFEADEGGCDFDDNEEDDDSGGWRDADEDECIPPVSRERLEEILAEIVERETFISAKESDGAVSEEDFCYIHKNNATILVDSDGKSPYLYIRVQNPNPNDKRNDLIIVLYTRPGAEYVFFFEFCKAGLLDSSINLDLDSDFDDLHQELEGKYLAGADKNERLRWQTNARILGRQNDVYFLCLDEEEDKESAR